MNPKKILIVDDSLIVRKALALKLNASGYETITVEGGAEAVRVVRSQKPDLVLLDVNFPPDVAHGGGVPWDGFMILNWLGRLEEGKDIPVIIITGADPATYESQARAAGVTCILHKPIDNDMLLQVIAEVLSTSARSRLVN